jgi:hypothetical protein
MGRIYMVGTHNVERRELQCRKKMKERAAGVASGDTAPVSTAVFSIRVRPIVRCAVERSPFFKLAAVRCTFKWVASIIRISVLI